MTIVHPVLRAVEAAAAAHEPFAVAGDVLHLRALELYVTAPEHEVGPVDAGVRCMVALQASLAADESGIVVVAVGVGTDESQAVQNAASQWVLGVLPVLAFWRRLVHSCFVSEECFSHPTAGPFRVFLGPVIDRGQCVGQTEPVTTTSYLRLLEPLLGPLPLEQSCHWLECFAYREVSGAVAATCRLDNFDWPDGQAALVSHVGSWSGHTPSMHARRQFVFFAPAPSSAPEVPASTSWWRRILGRT